MKNRIRCLIVILAIGVALLAGACTLPDEDKIPLMATGFDWEITDSKGNKVEEDDFELKAGESFIIKVSVKFTDENTECLDTSYFSYKRKNSAYTITPNSKKKELLVTASENVEEDTECTIEANYALLKNTLTILIKASGENCTVTFDSNGGNALESLKVSRGEKVTAPSAPTKTGYDFSGWYLVDEPFDFDSPITKSITLTALWTPLGQVKMPILSWAEEGNFALIKASEGATIYYTTDGNTPNENSTTYTSPIEITKPLTIKAIATKSGSTQSSVAQRLFEVYTVTFNLDGGVITQSDGSETPSIPSQSIRSGKPATNPTPTESEKPKRSEYKFNGWYKLDASGTMDTDAYNFNTPVTSDLTLKAKWGEQIVDKPTITIDDDDKVSITCPMSDAKIYYTLSPNNTTPPDSTGTTGTTGATGTTGSTDPTGATTGKTLYSAPFLITETTTIKAIAIKKDWKASPAASATYTFYTVTFNLDGGVITQSDGETTSIPSQSIRSGKPATDPTPTESEKPKRSEYKFNGWYKLDASGTMDTDAYNFNTPVTSNLTLKAKWGEQIVDIPTITIDDDDKVTITCPMSDAKIYYTLSPNNTTPPDSTGTTGTTGATGTTGSTDPTGATTGKTLYSAPFKITETTTIEAIAIKKDWKASPAASATYTFYTITFNLDGGSITQSGVTPTSIPSQSIRSGKHATNPTPTQTSKPKKSGYKFNGWYKLESDGTLCTTTYDFANPVTSDLTLKAKWGVATVKAHTATLSIVTYPNGITSTYALSIVNGATFAPSLSNRSFAVKIFKAITSSDTSIATAAINKKDNNVKITSVAEGTVLLTAQGTESSQYNTFCSIEITVKTDGSIVVTNIYNSNIFKPNNHVSIDAFWMSDHEVTQAEYVAVIGNNPSNFTENPATGEIQENRPVEQVSWYDAIKYCNERSLQENLTPCYSINGRTTLGTPPTTQDTDWDNVSCNFTANGYRLPTKEEWEYAARGGNGDCTVNIEYSGNATGDNLDGVAWNKNNSKITSIKSTATHEVKKKAPNEAGLYDLSGNVFEWCWDWFDESAKTYKIVRGSYYNDEGIYCTTYYLLRHEPEIKKPSVGIRLVRTGSGDSTTGHNFAAFDTNSLSQSAP